MGNDTASAPTAAEIRDLRAIAGTMVPASTEFAVPGADDPTILEDILRSLGRDLAHVRQAIALIADRTGNGFARFDADAREAVIADAYATGGPAMVTLGRVILGCYYRDDRVLRAIGHEPRPPFPKGNVVEQGDWSLLDVVRTRQPFWRDDRGA